MPKHASALNQSSLHLPEHSKPPWHTMLGGGVLNVVRFMYEHVAYALCPNPVLQDLLQTAALHSQLTRTCESTGSVENESNNPTES